MASCVREGRDRLHLSCAAIPSVAFLDRYRRGRLLLRVFGVVVLPVVPPVLLVGFFLVFLSALFWTWVEFAVVSSLLASSPPGEGAVVVSFRPRGSSCCCWSPWAALGLLVGAVCSALPLFLVLSEVLVVVDHAELSFSFLSFFTPIWLTSRRACILAIFTAFPSCGVPARWRDLRHVVLDICRK